MPHFFQTIPPVSGGDHPLSHARHVLQKVYGYSELRAHQKDVLGAFLGGQDTLAVIPTGGGKSMCYVLPALMGPGMGVVISPLISLIRDQVIKQRQAAIPAACLDSMQTPEQKRQVMEGLYRSFIKVLYISPERLATSQFRQFLAKRKLRFLAVDEAHCVSDWGSDFRPEYRKLGKYFDDFPAEVPRLAVTATATRKVRGDIVKYLRLRSHAEVIRNPLRKNLKIESRQLMPRSNHATAMVKKLTSSSGQGIIYTFSRKNTQRLAAILTNKSISVTPYHAGLSPERRNSALQQFLAGEVKVVVATNAFGLGIDKNNIRFVHHYGLPPSLESYLQQIGRAGRDGLLSRCCLFFQKGDASTHRYLWEKSYPPITLFTRIWHALQAHGSAGVSMNHLITQICGSGGIGDSQMHQIQTCISILTRERLVQSGSGSLSLMKNVGEEKNFKEFTEVFCHQRYEAERKLLAMERYAYAGHQREDVVKKYFEC